MICDSLAAFRGLCVVVGQFLDGSAPRHQRRRLDGSAAEQALASYLELGVPEIRRVLRGTWETQRGELSAEAVANAIAKGELSSDVLERWRQSYAAFVYDKLGRELRVGASRASLVVSGGLGFGLPAEAFAAVMDRHIDLHGGELVTNLSAQQHDAVRLVLNRAIGEGLAPATVAAQLQPIVGLTRRQARALEAFRRGLVEDETVPNAVVDRLVARRAEQMQGVRSMRIARTELANAYNEGAIQTVRVARDAGELKGEVTKVWLTGEDERVCPICGGLHETKAELDKPFAGGFDRPTAHPGCRCTMTFEVAEVEPEVELPPTDADEEAAQNEWGRLEEGKDVEAFVARAYAGPFEGYDEVRPTGSFREAKLAQEVRSFGEDGKGETSLEGQERARLEVNNLLAEYQITNHDVAVSRPAGWAKIPQPASERFPFRYRTTALTNHGPGLNPLGVHDFYGGIGLSEGTRAEVHRFFVRGVRDSRSVDIGAQTLIHEALHGASPITRPAFAGYGKALEEVFTEMGARAIVKDVWGAGALTYGAYPKLIGPFASILNESFVHAGGSSLGIHELYERIARGALWTKRVPVAGFVGSKRAYLDLFLARFEWPEGVDRVKAAAKIAERLEHQFEAQARQRTKTMKHETYLATLPIQVGDEDAIHAFAKDARDKGELDAELVRVLLQLTLEHQRLIDRLRELGFEGLNDWDTP